MCVTEIPTLVFNVFVSSTKLLVSTSVKHVCVQCQKYTSPAQNVFVWYDKPVGLQCHMSYLEMNNRVYLVASREHVLL